jgi:S-adenosylmethionine:tRNA ribosyltransferase-isomerase
MQLSDFSFDLPDELIARYPLDSRSASRLLHIDAQGQYHDHVFTDILDLLEEGDLLVLNDTKVMKARLKANVLQVVQSKFWLSACWTPTLHIAISNQVTHLKQAQNYIGEDAVPVTVQGRHENLFVVKFSQPILSVLDQYGQLPIHLISIVKQKRLIPNAIKPYSTILKKLPVLQRRQQAYISTKAIRKISR